eukprot:SAG31_NODE_802_length_12008_cov_18.741036_5_plen_63_part_00
MVEYTAVYIWLIGVGTNFKKSTVAVLELPLINTFFILSGIYIFYNSDSSNDLGWWCGLALFG